MQGGRVEVRGQRVAQVPVECDQPRALATAHAVDGVEYLATDLVRVECCRVLELEHGGTAFANGQPQLDLVGGGIGAAERDRE